MPKHPGDLPDPDWIMVGVPVDGGRKRLYASKEVIGARLGLAGVDSSAAWGITCPVMRQVLIITEDSYGQCLERLMAIWGASLGRPEIEGKKALPQPPSFRTGGALSRDSQEPDISGWRETGASSDRPDWVRQEIYDDDEILSGPVARIPVRAESVAYHSGDCLYNGQPHEGRCHPTSLFPVVVHDRMPPDRFALVAPGEDGPVVEGVIVADSADAVVVEGLSWTQTSDEGELTPGQILKRAEYGTGTSDPDKEK